MITPIEGRREPSHVNGEMTQSNDRKLVTKPERNRQSCLALVIKPLGNICPWKMGQSVCLM